MTINHITPSTANGNPRFRGADTHTTQPIERIVLRHLLTGELEVHPIRDLDIDDPVAGLRLLVEERILLPTLETVDGLPVYDWLPNTGTWRVI